MTLRDLMKSAFSHLNGSHGHAGVGRQLVVVKIPGCGDAMVVDRLHTQRTMDGDVVLVIELGDDSRELEPAGDAGEIGSWR